ncbi:MAG: TolC family protein [Armatimonadota bacterium]
MSRSSRWGWAQGAPGLVLLVSAMMAAAPLPAQEDGRPPSLPEAFSDGPLTIDEAVAIGLARHPVVSMARHGVKAARGGTMQTRSQFLPSLGFRSDYTRSMSTGVAIVGGVPVGGTTRRTATQYATSFQAQQLLFDFGRTSDEYRQSRLVERATVHQLAQTEDDVRDNVRQAFVALLANKELLEVARYGERLQEETLALTMGQFEGGLVPEADVAKAASALAAARLEVTAAENAVAQTQVALNETMGLDIRTQYEVAAPPALEQPPPALDELLAVAMARRPEILAAQADAQAAAAGLRAAKKGHAPGLSVAASYGWREPEFPPSLTQWNVGVALNLNVFDGAFTEGRRKQAQADRNAARDALYMTQQLVAEETAQSLLDLRTAEEQITAAEASVASAEEDLRLAQGRYLAQVGILLEILDAQAALIAARTALAQARFAYASARYALERAIGAPLAEVGAATEEAP